LIDPTKYGLAPEPLPQESIDAGADLCFFSGDKLLGGPQAGIIVGRKTYIEQLSTHPLARAFRIDKMNLAALTATLIHYLKEEAQNKIPVWQMVSAELEDLHRRADKLAIIIPSSNLYSVKVIQTKSTIGGGSLPGETMDSYGIQMKVNNPEKFARKIRTGITPVIPRIEKDAVIFDLRTILKNEDEALIASITHTLQN
jgi:L-seryl-tRNA(Ser) seleniumtransferase